MALALTGAEVFDGSRLHRGAVVVIEDGRVAALGDRVPRGAEEIRLPGGILAPGLIDLQVNGAGGEMVDGATDAARLARICAVQARLGATGVLPTLITDTPAATERVIEAGIAAAEAGVPGFLGLHLEGPHLDPRRAGAHDRGLIRPMEAADLALLMRAAARLPALMVTLAPSAASPAQIAALAGAGVVVSLGHSEATVEEAREAIAAGARAATHLFNAMSQLGARAPGLVGAVLTSGLAAGIIADGIHVSPEALRIACATRPEGLFLVSDCMAVAGTGAGEMRLGGRRILRRDGRLTLEDGTLAGADLTLPQALAVMVGEVGLPPERALAMATRVPADLIGRPDLGRIAEGGGPANLVHLDESLALQAVWQGGRRLP
jgi:N-acetylglucosamine-6-phosphate deacetylase